MRGGQTLLNTIAAAKSKELLVCVEDVQVLHGFDSKGTRTLIRQHRKTPSFRAGI